MEATVVTYNYNLTREQLVKFHLLFYCWTNDIKLTPAEMSTCIYLGLLGKQTLPEFCEKCVQKNIHESEDSARNMIHDLTKDKFMITKEGSHRKTVYISKDIGLKTDYNTILNIRCYYGDFKSEE